MYHVTECSINIGAYRNPTKHQPSIEKLVIVLVQQVIILEVSISKFLYLTLAPCKKDNPLYSTHFDIYL